MKLRRSLPCILLVGKLLEERAMAGKWKSWKMKTIEIRSEIFMKNGQTLCDSQAYMVSIFL